MPQQNQLNASRAQYIQEPTAIEAPIDASVLAAGNLTLLVERPERVNLSLRKSVICAVPGMAALIFSRTDAACFCWDLTAGVLKRVAGSEPTLAAAFDWEQQSLVVLTASRQLRRFGLQQSPSSLEAGQLRALPRPNVQVAASALAAHILNRVHCAMLQAPKTPAALPKVPM